MEHRLINTGATIPSSDKQQSVSVRKMPLCDLPNGTRNVMTSPQGSSLSREKRPFSDFLKVSGTKRRPDYLPSSHHPSTCNNGTNGHLVYVRRKLEETGKANTCDDVNMATSPKLRKFSDSDRNGLSHQLDHIETRVSFSPAFSPLPAASLTASSCGMSLPIMGMPTSGFLPIEPSSSLISSGIPVQTNSPSSNRVHWKERFLRLQMFLNSCDQSNREEYIQMLRSLSSVGRSKLAVELEKRAINLLLEEAFESGERIQTFLTSLGKLRTALQFCAILSHWQASNRKGEGKQRTNMPAEVTGMGG